jgi:hypothetical protein
MSRSALSQSIGAVAGAESEKLERSWSRSAEPRNVRCGATNSAG